MRPAYAAAALAAVHLAAVLAMVAPAPFDGGDNGAYLALARSLLEDGSYRELWDPAARPHAQYPPGWPLVLAGALAAGVKPWMGFKVLAALFSAAAVALSYLWARRVSTPGIALVCGLLLAFGPGVADLGRQELSDVPFWTFCMLALWGFAGHARREPEPEAAVPRRKSMAPLALAAAGVLLAYLTRSAGLPLLAAACAWLAWSRRWRALGLVAAVVAPFALAWMARARMVADGGYAGFLWYADPYRPALGTIGPAEMAGRAAANLSAYAQDHLPFLLTGQRTGWAALALGAAVLGLAFAGWAMRVRRGAAGVAGWWLPPYLAVVLVWPLEWAAARLLLPVLPVLLLFAAEAAGALASRARRPGRARELAAAGVLAAALAVALPRLTSEAVRMAACRADARAGDPYPCMRPPMADYLGLGRSLRGALPPGSVVIARKPTLWWAESGYPARVYPFTTDPDALLRAAEEAGARYVVIDHVDNLSSIHLAPAIAQRPQAFCAMRTRGPERATLMGIVPGADTLPNLRDRPQGEVVELGFSWCGPEYWAAGAAPPESVPTGGPADP